MSTTLIVLIAVAVIAPLDILDPVRRHPRPDPTAEPAIWADAR